MLILTRKLNQAIIIDGEIKITVININRGQIRLGITAPEGVIIDREEIHEKRISEEKDNV